MNKFSKYISSQFKNPRGIGGVIISIIQNVINKTMYKRAVSLINLQSNENTLDIGYGNGHLLEMIYSVYCIIKIPTIAEGNPQSCMRIFPIIADAFGISLRPQ